MDYLGPILFVVAVWWASTSALLYRMALPAATATGTLVGATLVAGLGFGAILFSLGAPTVTGVYAGFAGALAVWAGHETSYLLGRVSGPRPRACPPAAAGWRRFGYGVLASLYHEVAIILTAALIAALSWQSVNRVALWTFVILWLMRWSAKLNIFLGVRNLHREYWPEHLRYLQSFTRERRMNALFPVSVTLAGVGVAMLATAAASAGADAAGRTGAVLLATLLALAVIEHVCLMLRVPDDLLWRLGNRPRRPSETPSGNA